MRPDLFVPLDFDEVDFFDDTPILLFTIPIALIALPTKLGFLKNGGIGPCALFCTPEGVALAGIVFGVGRSAFDPVKSLLAKGSLLVK